MSAPGAKPEANGPAQASADAANTTATNTKTGGAATGDSAIGHPGSTADYCARARARLPPGIWAYLADGDNNGNDTALASVRLMPRPLQDLRGGHTRLKLFSQTLEHPVLLAPVAYQRLFHADAECGSAMAAAAQGGQSIISSLASQRFEVIVQAALAGAGYTGHTDPTAHLGHLGHTVGTAGTAGAACTAGTCGTDESAVPAPTPGPWFQLYWQGDRARTLRLLQRALDAGCSAVVLTVDAPVKRATLRLPDHVQAVNLEHPEAAACASAQQAGFSQVFDGWMAQAPTWDDLAWLRRQTHLPLLVKGLMHPDDAEAALAAGCDGLVVSNHGGRVLAGATPSLQALKAIAARVRGRVPVLFDSGIRGGRDVFVALAHGATAVLLGRPFVWGLAVDGALGVARVIRLLRDELELTMALTGCRNLEDIGAHGARR